MYPCIFVIVFWGKVSQKSPVAHTSIT